MVKWITVPGKGMFARIGSIHIINRDDLVVTLSCILHERDVLKTSKRLSRKRVEEELRVRLKAHGQAHRSGRNVPFPEHRADHYMHRAEEWARKLFPELGKEE